MLPAILAGFGMTTFVYWRGNGIELEQTGARWRWTAPDGSAVTALLLPEGYFNAACLPADPDEAARGLASTARRLREAHGDPVVLMNGFDHMLPDAHTREVAERLAGLLGEPVERVLFDDVVAAEPAPSADFAGELLGARLANLLPGVWSTRMAIKLANRRCETLLQGWVEPWAALGRMLGLPDERASLTGAWRTLVQNHAHDSICGCSLDAVADRTMARFADAEGLAEATLARLLDRLAGQGAERRTPPTLAQEIAVFNPSPHPRTDVVRVPLDPYPAMRIPLGLPEFAPLALAASAPPGFAAGGQAVRVLPADDPARVRWLPGQTPFDVELVVRDVPAFGLRRIRLEPADPVPDVVDEGRAITAGEVAVAVSDDGTLDVRFGDTEYAGLFAIEDAGDRGDSYDHDPVPGAAGLAGVTWTRRRHPSGIAVLEVHRVLRMPAALTDDRTARANRAGRCHAHDDGTGRPARDARRRPGADRQRRVGPPPAPARPDRPARHHGACGDHVRCGDASDRAARRCRLGAPGAAHLSTSGLGVGERPHGGRTGPSRGRGHAGRHDRADAAPRRRMDRTLRPPHAPDPGRSRDGDPGRASTRPARGADLAACPATMRRRHGTRSSACAARSPGPSRCCMTEVALLALEPPTLVLSALKPAEAGAGIVVRVLNPTDQSVAATLRVAFGIAAAHGVRLDETPADDDVALDARTIRFTVPASGLRSLRLVPG